MSDKTIKMGLAAIAVVSFLILLYIFYNDYLKSNS